jgi:4-amino-4-deoxy-L-arabinose transferase-like glycosyltransferase
MSNGYNFIYYHFGYHVLLRALTPLEGHGAPWWFYLRIIAARDVFPFIEILFIGLIIAIRDKHFFRRIRIFGPVILFILFLFIPLMAQTKLSWYILPVYPFAALLTGRFSRRLWDYMRSEKTSSFIRIASILVLMYMMIVLVISIRANIRSIIIHSPPQNPAVAYNR